MKFPAIELINVIPLEKAEAFQEELEQKKFVVFNLNGSNIQSIKDMLDQSSIDLPQPSDTSPPYNLSALSDNLWQGFSNLEQVQVAVFWNHADVLLAHRLKDFLKLVDLFTTLSRQLVDQPKEITLVLVLVGSGESFQLASK